MFFSDSTGMLFSGSILAFLLGAATLVLQVYSLKSRNPFFASVSKRLLTLSLCFVFIPTLILCYVQVDYGPLAIKADDAEWAKRREANKYVSRVTLRWKPNLATKRSQISLLSETVDKRLERAGQTSYMVDGVFDGKNSFTVIKSKSPKGFDPTKLHTLITEAVTPTIKLQPETPLSTLSDDEKYDKLLSVRSIHPSQERLSLSDYVETPEGYTRMPWKDGFVYVSDSYHINDFYVYNAKPYSNSSILLTLTPQGVNRMNMMADFVSQAQMKVAVIYKDKIRGIYEPQLCATDQLLISDILETPEQLELDADLLSEPKGFFDLDSTSTGYDYPPMERTMDFPLPIYKFLCSQSLKHLWMIVYGFLLLAASLFLLYIHVKTKPKEPNSEF